MAFTDPGKRKLPKLYACTPAKNLTELRNQCMMKVKLFDAKHVRREKLSFYECIIHELTEAGFVDSADYIRDLIYYNSQLAKEDDVGFIVDLRTKHDILEDIANHLRTAEMERDKGNTKMECTAFLKLAMNYSDVEKGLIWLPERLFLASLAVVNKYIADGGRLKAICKYCYGKFLVEKFPEAHTNEAYHLLSEVREASIGKGWLLYEDEKNNGDKVYDDTTVLAASSLLLHGLLLKKSRHIRQTDAMKSETLCRIAEKRARDAQATHKIAEALVEMGIAQFTLENYHSALSTFEKAYKLFAGTKNVLGKCTVNMHLAAVHQRLGKQEKAVNLLTEMGKIALQAGARIQLGISLHLLGELHLRNGIPELGTQHLMEAFQCFMGSKTNSIIQMPMSPSNEEILDDGKSYIEEAEQSRFTMAISSGQEKIASYFNLVRQANVCHVAWTQLIEWKTSSKPWWRKSAHLLYISCSCPIHNLSVIDIVRLRESTQTDKSEGDDIDKENSSTDQDSD